MKKVISYVLGATLFTMALSCKKGLITYQDKPDVYFYDSGRLPAFQGDVPTDSTSLSFSLAKVQDSTIKIIIAASGGFSDRDRTYSLSVNPASTALVGTHYDALPATFT